MLYIVLLALYFLLGLLFLLGLGLAAKRSTSVRQDADGLATHYRTDPVAPPGSQATQVSGGLYSQPIPAAPQVISKVGSPGAIPQTW
jgi:hypothetical protein